MSSVFDSETGLLGLSSDPLSNERRSDTPTDLFLSLTNRTTWFIISVLVGCFIAPLPFSPGDGAVRSPYDADRFGAGGGIERRLAGR